MTTLIYKIPPRLPFALQVSFRLVEPSSSERDRSGSETKGRDYPSLIKRGEGRFFGYVFSIEESG